MLADRSGRNNHATRSGAPGAAPPSSHYRARGRDRPGRTDPDQVPAGPRGRPRDRAGRGSRRGDAATRGATPRPFAREPRGPARRRVVVSSIPKPPARPPDEVPWPKPPPPPRPPAPPP